MRSGYEAEACRFARINMVTRFVAVLMEMMQDWKLAKIQGDWAKCEAK